MLGPGVQRSDGERLPELMEKVFALTEHRRNRDRWVGAPQCQDSNIISRTAARHSPVLAQNPPRQAAAVGLDRPALPGREIEKRKDGLGRALERAERTDP